MMDRDWPLKFEVISKCNKTKARAGILTLPHGKVETPVFMPVGTHGTIKSLLPEDLLSINDEILLGNTYHLGMKPGVDIIKKCGGLHSFMNWPRNILTEGVQFTHPSDGSPCFLTPEKSIEIQMGLGSDIMMQLDDVVSSVTTGARVEEAMWRYILLIVDPFDGWIDV